MANTLRTNKEMEEDIKDAIRKADQLMQALVNQWHEACFSSHWKARAAIKEVYQVQSWEGSGDSHYVRGTFLDRSIADKLAADINNDPTTTLLSDVRVIPIASAPTLTYVASGTMGKRPDITRCGICGTDAQRTPSGMWRCSRCCLSWEPTS